MSMKMGNKINMTITNARMTRLAKTRVWTSGSMNAGSTRATGSGSVQNSGNKELSQIEKLIEKQTKSLSYNMLKDSSERVESRIKKMLETGDKSLFGQEDTTEARTEAVKEIKNLVNDYNLMIGKLNGSKNSEDIAYAKKLKALVTEYGSALKKAGITQSSTGLLVIDEKVLKGASLSQLGELFGKEGGFSDKIGTQAKEICEYAQKQLQELSKSIYTTSSSYNRNGTDGNIYGGTSSYNARS